ncbi:MYND-type domain-containing protein [Favolaschia claudopus]|uniref:MYND-type domain-containing protein n=1 Tax=Favolaschia claudopus TaxID=2862362 RepID=A0AAW0DZ09_9AGAR
MDPRTFEWPPYKRARNISNFVDPWIPPTPDFLPAHAVWPKVADNVDEAPNEPISSSPRKKLSEALRKVFKLKRNATDSPRQNIHDPDVESHHHRERSDIWALSFEDVPESRWRAYGLYRWPTVNGIEVHNSAGENSTPSPTPYRQLQLGEEVDYDALMRNLCSPGGMTLYPERWIRGLKHPSLPPEPADWRLPGRGQPLPFPWECQLNRNLKRSVSGTAPLFWNIQRRDQVMWGGPENICIPISNSEIAEPATYPLITHMFISAVACADAGFPWKFLIINPRGIKVLDVIDAIHENFHQMVWPHEFTSWNEDRRTRAEFEYKLRGGELNAMDGLRRIDYLCGQTCFRGLEYNPDRTGWILYVGPHW